MRSQLVFVGLFVILFTLFAPAAALAAGEAASPGGAARSLDLAGLGAAVGAGLITIGAGVGIGRFAAAAADGIARQPSAASSITSAVNLPLFLLEGVSIIGLVVCILVILMRT
jgi:F-type H+-transporting ATPase subunit c